MFLTREQLFARFLYRMCELFAATVLMAAMVFIFAVMFLTWGM